MIRGDPEDQYLLFWWDDVKMMNLPGLVSNAHRNHGCPNGGVMAK
jgi:hypothetical protein